MIHCFCVLSGRQHGNCVQRLRICCEVESSYACVNIYKHSSCSCCAPVLSFAFRFMIPPLHFSPDQSLSQKHAHNKPHNLYCSHLNGHLFIPSATSQPAIQLRLTLTIQFCPRLICKSPPHLLREPLNSSQPIVPYEAPLYMQIFPVFLL